MNEQVWCRSRGGASDAGNAGAGRRGSLGRGPAGLKSPLSRRSASETAQGFPSRRMRRWGAPPLALWLAALLAAWIPPAAASQTWLHVDTRAATLSVMRGEDPVVSFKGISIGRAGVSRERHQGDRRTPLGEFRIAKIKERSQFHRFFIIDYPNRERADIALERGEIDAATHRAIRRALRAGELPPQHTPLGGNLGIHGIGGGDPQLHEAFNWTQGCIALTNGQIDSLSQWIRVGTRVVID